MFNIQLKVPSGTSTIRGYDPFRARVFSCYSTFGFYSANFDRLGTTTTHSDMGIPLADTNSPASLRSCFAADSRLSANACLSATELRKILIRTCSNSEIGIHKLILALLDVAG